MTAKDCNLIREFKKQIDSPSTDQERCSKFTLEELIFAKRNDATGPDSIPPTCLKDLSPIVLRELLKIFNAPFLYADFPKICWVATIISILKAGKPTSEVASYWPISLSSSIVKLLERILANRLYYITKSKHLFSRF